MDRNRSSYSINVTFKQIVLFLFAVVVISFITFILGYRAGKNSTAKGADGQLIDTAGRNNIQELSFDDSAEDRPEAPVTREEIQSPETRQEVSGEEDSLDDSDSRPEAGGVYYYIQVGAFSQPDNARKYARKFDDQGYFTEISPITVKGKILYRVQVGRFDDKTEADRIRKKLEKQEGKKFPLKLSR